MSRPDGMGTTVRWPFATAISKRAVVADSAVWANVGAYARRVPVAAHVGLTSTLTPHDWKSPASHVDTNPLPGHG